jgi:hypothetical protein
MDSSMRGTYRQPDPVGVYEGKEMKTCSERLVSNRIANDYLHLAQDADGKVRCPAPEALPMVVEAGEEATGNGQGGGDNVFVTAISPKTLRPKMFQPSDPLVMNETG